MSLTPSLLEGGDAGGGTTVTTANPITAVSNRLYLAFVRGREAGGGGLPTVAGGGLTTWTQIVDYQYNGNVDRLTVFRALQASPGSAATVTATWGVSQSDNSIQIVEVPGVVTSGTNGSDAASGTNNNNVTGTGTGTGAVTLSAFSNADNISFLFGNHDVWFEAASGGANTTSLTNFGSGSGTSHLLWCTTASPSATWSTSNVYGFLALEVVAAATGTDATVTAAVGTATASVVAPPKPRPETPFSEINVRM